MNIFFGEPEDILADPEVAGIEPVFVEVPKGSVAFHHGLTVHLANANDTDAPAPSTRSSTSPTATPAATRSPHFCVDRNGIEVGQPIDSDATPIVWPRPDGDLPPVPAVPIHVPNAVVANSGATPAAAPSAAASAAPPRRGSRR